MAIKPIIDRSELRRDYFRVSDVYIPNDLSGLLSQHGFLRRDGPECDAANLEKIGLGIELVVLAGLGQRRVVFQIDDRIIQSDLPKTGNYEWSGKGIESY